MLMENRNEDNKISLYEALARSMSHVKLSDFLALTVPHSYRTENLAFYTASFPTGSFLLCYCETANLDGFRGICS